MYFPVFFSFIGINRVIGCSRLNGITALYKFCIIIIIIIKTAFSEMTVKLVGCGIVKPYSLTHSVRTVVHIMFVM